MADTNQDDPANWSDKKVISEVGQFILQLKNHEIDRGWRLNGKKQSEEEIRKHLLAPLLASRLIPIAKRCGIDFRAFCEFELNPSQENLSQVEITLRQLEWSVEDTPQVASNSGREPLSQNARKVYEMLLELPEHSAMTGPQIIDAMLNRHGVNMDESTLRKYHLPELGPYGLKSKKRIGYYIPLNERSTQ